MTMSENETETPAEVRRDVEPIDLMERAAHYASPGAYRNPETGKLVTPTVHNDGTSAQKRRLKHKENHAIAQQVRVAEEKVSRLRGAAKKSATATLDKLKKLFV